MEDNLWKRARDAAVEAASKAGGKWLTKNGHASRFAGMSPDAWRAFIETVTDEHASTFEETAERLAIKAADDVPF